MKRTLILLTLFLLPFALLQAADEPKAERGKKKAAKAAKAAGKPQTPPPTHPPLTSVEVNQLPAGVERVDIYLLMGQSNMKGRGTMPDQPLADPRIVMMAIPDDHWYLARHPLHLTGDPKTFEGHDNAGVGSGLAFAQTLAAADPKARIALVPTAVGGTSIKLWVKGARLYENAVRKAKLAVQTTAPSHGVIRGAIWLQGEADSNDRELPTYQQRLVQMITDLRTDLQAPDMPFVACTIGEFKSDETAGGKKQMNALLLGLGGKLARTGCVDARDLKGHIGDSVHFDTASQDEIGRRFAAIYLQITGGK